MRNQLSARKYIKNNKKQAGVMMIALSLTFMTMYVIHFIFLTTQESFRAIFLEQPKKVAMVSLSAKTMGINTNLYETEEKLNEAVSAATEDILVKIRQHKGVSDAYETQCLYANYAGIIGSIGYDFPLLETSKIPGYLEHMGAKLIQGNLPEQAGEILVDKKVLKNQKMKIGSYFNEEFYGKVFKVAGVIESDNLTCVGTPMGYTNSGWYIVILCNEENCNMTKLLKDIGIIPTAYDTIYDAESWKDMYREIDIQIDGALTAILIVVMIFLTISILVAYISFMRSRVNEYCLYASIGFGRNDVYGMMMKEIAIIFGGSILIGAVISVMVMIILGNTFLDHIGFVYKYFYPEQMLRILAAFMAVIGFLQIPIIITINNIKTIDLIEE